MATKLAIIWLATVVALRLTVFVSAARPTKVEPGDPLILTPYITSGQIDQGRALSQVGELPGLDIVLVSYSGYLTVDDTYNSNLFFWFFEAMNNHKTAPVLLWLQGNQGSCDMYGLFAETGPHRVDPNSLLNNYTLAAKYNMLYIDNPVGTGFSFTASVDGYSWNEEDVSNNLDNALRQFFTLFPEYIANDFYITRESYGAKYIPATVYKVDLNNAAATIKINLKGVSFGTSLIDPIPRNKYGDYQCALGLIDRSQRDFYLEQQALLVQDIQNGDYAGAFAIFVSLLNGDFYLYPTYFKNCTKLDYYYDLFQPNSRDDQDYHMSYINQDLVRAAIHVGNVPFNDGDIWENVFMNSTKPLIYDGYRDYAPDTSYRRTISPEELYYRDAEDFYRVAEDLTRSSEKLARSAEDLYLSAEKLRSSAEEVHMDAEKVYMDAEEVYSDAEKVYSEAENLCRDSEEYYSDDGYDEEDYSDDVED